MGPDPETAPARVVEALKAALGPKGWLEAAADKAPYLGDERGLYRGATPLVLRPASTREVSRVVEICAAAGVGLVPQGGNTGYVGGSVPSADGSQVLLSLGRMNRIRAVDPVNDTMTVEAGCVLADVQRAAAEAGRLFPLSLGAEGTCQIGGNLSTNAGGIAVLRYGNARELVLGLEVVLPDGRVWDGLRGLRKDNRGYDLKQLFLGAEGTLGVITAAVVKLFPRPNESCTALVAVSDAAAAIALLTRLKAAAGEAVTSFEYMRRACLDLVLEHLHGHRDPFGQPYDHYALLELAWARRDGGLQDLLESEFAEALEAGQVIDAVVAASGAQASSLWALRESIPEAQKHAGGSIKHDVSVPISRVADFLDRASALAEQAVAGIRVMPFGHLGDGNIHFNLLPPRGVALADLGDAAAAVSVAVHDLAVALGGSFSAEHGIGQLKKGELRRYKAAVELEVMAAVKHALDPKGIMNPGKVL